jgi:RNA-directed DNA polymerase
MAQAQRYREAGRRGVGDGDVAPCCARVHHAGRLGRRAKRSADKRVLRRMRRALAAGVRATGGVIERPEGRPPGGPWAPRWATVRVDDGAQERARRGHACVRAAEACHVYGRSRQAGARVLVVLRTPDGQRRWRLNEATRAVARVRPRACLGSACWRGAGGNRRRRVADTALEALKHRGREITGRRRGRRGRHVVEERRRDRPGRRASVGMAETPEVFRRLDEWRRQRLRPLALKPWQTATRAPAACRARGAAEALARRVGGRWQRGWSQSTHAAHVVLTQAYVDGRGVPRRAP